MMIELQIDDGDPFEVVPIDCNILHARTEIIRPESEVVENIINSSVAKVHYFNTDERLLETLDYYRFGSWETGKGGMPRFHVRELLRMP